MITELFALFGFVLLLIHLRTKIGRKRQSKAPLPPTPKRIPILGSFPFLRGRPVYEFLEEFDKEEGPHPLVYLQAINRHSVFVNDARLARKIFIELGKFSSDRPFLPVFELNNTNNLGIVCAPSHRWMSNRRFALRILREFGLGKAHIIDNLIDREMSIFRSKIEAVEGKPVYPGPICNRLVGGVVSSLLFGQNLSDEGSWFDNMLRDTNIFLQQHYVLIFFFPNLSFLYSIPFLSKLIPSYEGVVAQKRVTDYMKKTVSDVRKTLSTAEKANLEPTNFIEAYLLDPNNPSQEEGGFMKNTETEDTHLGRILLELFVAGVDTTAMTLEWGMTLLSLHPEVQERAHKEIEEKLGSQATIKYSHIQDLPFVKAVVHEVMRYGCVAAASIPHTVTEDLTIETDDGATYCIPANCYLSVNIYSLLRSSKYWKRPHDFDPAANFMDDAGKDFELRHPDAFLPFSLGRRVCIGESLARNESFVALASILQSYRIRVADKYANFSKEELMEPWNCGPARGPRHVELVFEHRA